MKFHARRDVRKTSTSWVGWLGRAWIKLTVIGVLCAILSVALQTTVLSRISLPFLSPGAPSLTLLAVLLSGFFLGEREGAVMGVICGFFIDAAMGETWMLMPILYTLCGYMVGALAKDRLARNLPSFLVWVLIGGVWEQMTVYMRGIMTVGGFPPAEMLSKDLLPRLILTLLFAFITYPTAKLIIKIFVRK